MKVHYCQDQLNAAAHYLSRFNWSRYSCFNAAHDDILSIINRHALDLETFCVSTAGVMIYFPRELSDEVYVEIFVDPLLMFSCDKEMKFEVLDL